MRHSSIPGGSGVPAAFSRQPWQSREQRLRPLALGGSHSHREMLPRSDPPDETGHRPLPPQQAEEGHAVLAELGRGEQRDLEGVGAKDEHEGVVLDLCGRHGGLGGLDEGLVEEGARLDEGAPRDEGHQDGAGGVACYAAGHAPEGEGGDLDGLGAL